jgi:hypothetical protein
MSKLPKTQEQMNREFMKLSQAELEAEGFAYTYTDKDGKVWVRLKEYAHITPPNKRFDS